MNYGSLWFNDGTWHMDAQPHVHMRAKRVFGRLKSEARGVLTLKNSSEVCADLRWFTDRYPLAIDAESLRVLDLGAAKHRETQKALEDLIGRSYQPTDFKLTKPPRSYQAKEAEILLRVGGLLVGDDVGLGKTVTAICAAQDERARPALIVCQPHLVRQWRDKFVEFAPGMRTHIIKKGTPYTLPQFFGQRPDVLISSYGRTTGGWAKILAQYCNLVVFDEMQELRHMGTQRYNAAWELCQGIAYRLGLSATPIYNYGGEIYSTVNLLRPGVLGDYFEFTTEWCSRGGEKATLEDPKAFGTWARDNFIMIRHTRQEVGRELPPVTRIVQPVESDTERLGAIKVAAAELARTILTSERLEQGAQWEAARELSVLLRKWTGIAKAPYVAEFVRMLLEQEKQVVLCGWHRHVYDVWLERLADYNPLLYTGTETPAEKDATKKRFVSGESRLLILSLRSGAGLDGLQEASNDIVFGELDWSPGVHEQCIGRLARDGQPSPVMAYFMVSNDGSDPTMVEMLGLKREQKEGIMNPTQEFLERVDDGGDHVKRLAAAYLKQIGEREPDHREKATA